jgi:hypothetical protein
LFEADAGRKIKKEPPVAVELRKDLDLFPAEGESVGGGVVSEIWSFNA